ncbi:hypothetical protein QE152_g10838 [Popillia japonica]|uniref:Transposase n=1 Tax=Popillia japonica TaxID=7064 RepID=A0AAW1LTG9_POPJA
MMNNPYLRAASVRAPSSKKNHLQTGSLKKFLGRNPLLSDDQETDLVSSMRFAEIGLPVTRRILRPLVYKFCELNNIKHNFNRHARVAGKDWFKAFVKRHSEISRRKARFMNPARAQKLNKFIVDDHFKRLNEVYDHLHLKSHPEKIYNMDEKGCRLTIRHQQTVLAKKGAKRVHLQSSEHAESVTIAGCVNALGSAIPPMIIFKGKRLKPEIYDNLSQGSLVEKSAKDYMTNELFKEFLKHLARYKSPLSKLQIHSTYHYTVYLQTPLTNSNLSIKPSIDHLNTSGMLKFYHLWNKIQTKNSQRHDLILSFQMSGPNT